MTTTDSTFTMTDDRREQVREMVCEILEIEPSEMTGSSLFKDDHGADSMGVIEILSSLEREFGVDIDQNELSRMVNLDGVLAVVQDAASA